jgi:hypothetical protein
MSIFWKMAVFIENYPVTSSNCYKTIKNCFNANQTWHKCWLDHCLCHNMPRLKFPVIMAMRGHLKNHYFAMIFFHQNWFQSAATPQWIEIESNFKPQTEGGTSPFLQPPDVYFGWEKVVTFFNNIAQTKQGIFSPFEITKGGDKGVNRRVYRVMG